MIGTDKKECGSTGETGSPLTCAAKKVPNLSVRDHTGLKCLCAAKKDPRSKIGPLHIQTNDM